MIQRRHENKLANFLSFHSEIAFAIRYAKHRKCSESLEFKEGRIWIILQSKLATPIIAVANGRPLKRTAVRMLKFCLCIFSPISNILMT